MHRWIPYAFVRITIYYSSGVLLGILFPALIEWPITMGACAASTAVYVICVFAGKGKSVFAGMFAALAIMSSGNLNVLFADESREAQHLVNVQGNITAFRAIVEGAPQERQRTWKYEVSINQVLVNGSWKDAHSRVLVYIRKDTLSSRYQYGDVVVARGTPVRIQSPQNPGEFDLEKYLRYRQIYFQSMLAPGQVQCIGSSPSSSFMLGAITARLWAEGIIERHIPGTRERAIASAFVLGVTDGLDEELMNAYSATGAMHVLSVSGLHVGIVYWLLLLMFKPFGTRHTRWPLLVISLGVLWSYAFVTGISSSVLRAVVMFSFAAIARAWHLKMNIYNILAATAFMLLVVDPFMIMSVGFQLSFVAVLGIVAVQPALYRLWEPTGWLWDEIWKVCAVSIAAQVATLPLCLFYFHQFPNYFLITNLFIVPGSFVVLILGICLLVVSAADVIADLIGFLLEQLIAFLNFLIFTVEGLPWSAITNIFITPFQCVTLAALLIMAWVITENRSRVAVGMALTLIVTFSTTSWIYTMESGTPRLIVYAVRGSSAIDVMVNYTTLSIGPPSAEHLRQRIPYRIALRSADRVEDLNSASVVKGCDLYVWQGHSIACISSPISDFTSSRSVDLVIISNNSVKDMARLARSIVAKCYVIDGSNNRVAAASLSAQAAELPLRVHNVLNQGAFELRF